MSGSAYFAGCVRAGGAGGALNKGGWAVGCYELSATALSLSLYLSGIATVTVSDSFSFIVSFYFSYSFLPSGLH